MNNQYLFGLFDLLDRRLLTIDTTIAARKVKELKLAALHLLEWSFVQKFLEFSPWPPDDNHPVNTKGPTAAYGDVLGP
ncbi:hypothetical protein KIN20_007063 [Parelaphostrongylus tenuis]|uniref:Uncharacterized protein n=1 Tax=Parelaphostrongylus tenuis TaxID=148309 RepID=A0AAD5MLL3_PARTN|nr:hypothetical protein KIN20_007063 [Parelaphostrongylus tenuis]